MKICNITNLFLLYILGVELSVDAITILAKHKNIIGMKESNGDVSNILFLCGYVCIIVYIGKGKPKIANW